MRIISCTVENFASYYKLEFNFSDQGLCLIQGPTGAGKSTLCDVIPWILFGRTAKDGAVDEVRSWHTGEPTKGTLTIDLNGKIFQVGRVRGAAKDNDLIIWQDGGAYRGKDLNDTQKLINQALGFGPDLYLAGAYYHEFSQTAQFFQTTAKNRRTICEQLVDLSLANKLQPRLSEENSRLKKEIIGLGGDVSEYKSKVEMLTRFSREEKEKLRSWDKIRAEELKELAVKARDFAKNTTAAIKDLETKSATHKKAQQQSIRDINSQIYDNRISILDDACLLEQLRVLRLEEAALKDKKCETCGNPVNSEHVEHALKRRFELEAMRDLSAKCRTGVEKLERQLKSLKAEVNPYIAAIQAAEKRENTYIAQLQELESQTNPYKETRLAREAELKEATGKLDFTMEKLSKAKLDKADIETLMDVVTAYRSASVRNTIQAVQDRTNGLLAEYFDAEIRATFSAEDADKLEVEITKDGNVAAFTQLSKGQRQLLKLCFSVSVMQTIAERQAVKFEQLFFDESMDGLDEVLKGKAFRLLEALSLGYDSVYVVEHSEGLKLRFANKFSVELVNGRSEIA